MVQSFLAHEQEHAAKLTELVRNLGGTPYQPNSADEYARGFAPMESREDVLRVAVRVERDALSGYLEDGTRLTDPGMRQMAAAIATIQAEHLSVLLAALGQPPVPGPFAGGVGMGA